MQKCSCFPQSRYLFCLIFFGVRVLPRSSGWPWTHGNLSASAYWVLGHRHFTPYLAEYFDFSLTWLTRMNNSKPTPAAHPGFPWGERQSAPSYPSCPLPFCFPHSLPISPNITQPHKEQWEIQVPQGQDQWSIRRKRPAPLNLSLHKVHEPLLQLKLARMLGNPGFHLKQGFIKKKKERNSSIQSWRPSGFFYWEHLEIQNRAILTLQDVSPVSIIFSVKEKNSFWFTIRYISFFPLIIC